MSIDSRFSEMVFVRSVDMTGTAKIRMALLGDIICDESKFLDTIGMVNSYMRIKKESNETTATILGIDDNMKELVCTYYTLLGHVAYIHTIAHKPICIELKDTTRSI
jgi:hypothetical protein